MFLPAFHQLQYFSHVHMLCATCKSSPQVLRLKPWTCASKKRRKIQMLPHRAGKEFAFISVLRLRFAPILGHWLHISVSPLEQYFSSTTCRVFLLYGGSSGKVGDQMSTMVHQDHTWLTFAWLTPGFFLQPLGFVVKSNLHCWKHAQDFLACSGR